MKLCPQCEFIYEDDQSLCDMDGSELVYDPGSLSFAGNVPFISPELFQPAPIPASLTARPTASHPMRWQSRSSAVVALAAIILAALLFVVYYARTHQARSGNENQTVGQTSTQSSNQSSELATVEQEPGPDLDSAPSAAPSTSAESSSASNVTTMSPSSLPISSTASLSRGRLANNPVTAAGFTADSRAPVIIRLTNGASIKADEAWEKREGVWYRQAGMVTFLKRNRVRAIQRPGAPNARVKSPTINPDEKNRKAGNLIAQNQPRAGRPEAVSPNKESRVTSFLKKTGRVLKKPFRL